MTRRDDPAVHSMHPLQLLTPRRLDLVCKYLYFRELRSATDTAPRGSPVARLYQKHIAVRTGGLEPPDPFYTGQNTTAKQSVADYERHAKLLLTSLSSNGFDPEAAVPYFTDGTLGNGAHRVSAALALDMPIVARRHEGHGTPWGFDWFVENGFTTDELQRLLYAYTNLKPDRVAIFICYSPARQYWDSFTRTIADNFDLVGQVDLAIDSALGMYEAVHDLYATLEPLSSTGVINRKALLLAMARPLALRVILAERWKDDDDVYELATGVKNRCREAARDVVAPESYLAVHAGSSRAETLNLARVLFSPNNIHQLHRRRSAGVRTEFLKWLAECRDVCVRDGIALDEICVVGSSPLEVIGVRPSTDVDFTLKSHYRKARYGSGVTHLTPSVDIVTEGYHRHREQPAIGDDDLIDNPDYHFMFRGLKFANPEIVLGQKDFYRRDKDVRDVERAAALFAAADSASFDPSFEFASRTETLLRELMDGNGLAVRPHQPASNVSRSVGRSFRALTRRLSEVRHSLHHRLRMVGKSTKNAQ